MINNQPIGIQIHLASGNKRMFYQDNAEQADRILKDLDGRVFTRDTVIIEGPDAIHAFPSNELIGISIITDLMPESFMEMERASETVVSQIAQDAYLFQHHQYLTKVVGKMSSTFSELEFVSGERLFFEMQGITENIPGERFALNHLFKSPSLFCRRLHGGFSIWNTRKVVSWTLYPKLESPSSAWQAESLNQDIHGKSDLINML